MTQGDGPGEDPEALRTDRCFACYRLLGRDGKCPACWKPEAGNGPSRPLTLGHRCPKCDKCILGSDGRCPVCAKVTLPETSPPPTPLEAPRMPQEPRMETQATTEPSDSGKPLTALQALVQGVSGPEPLKIGKAFRGNCPTCGTQYRFADYKRCFACNPSPKGPRVTSRGGNVATPAARAKPDIAARLPIEKPYILGDEPGKAPVVPQEAYDCDRPSDVPTAALNLPTANWGVASRSVSDPFCVPDLPRAWPTPLSAVQPPTGARLEAQKVGHVVEILEGLSEAAIDRIWTFARSSILENRTS